MGLARRSGHEVGPLVSIGFKPCLRVQPAVPGFLHVSLSAPGAEPVSTMLLPEQGESWFDTV